MRGDRAPPARLRIEARTIPASCLESRLSKSGCNPHKTAVSENAKAGADLNLQFEFERPLGDAGVARLSIAELAGVVDLLFADTELGSGSGGKVLAWNFGSVATPCSYLPRRLRSIIFIIKPALGSGFDFQTIGLNAVDGQGRAKGIGGLSRSRRTRRSPLSRLWPPSGWQGGDGRGQKRGSYLRQIGPLCADAPLFSFDPQFFGNA